MFDSTLKFDPGKCIEGLGLDARGKVQEIIDSEVLRLSEPYSPFLEGHLIDSGSMHTIIGSGEVVYACDNKARRLYYGEMDWDWSNGGVQVGGLRGPYWVDRAMNDGGKEQVEAVAREAVRK